MARSLPMDFSESLTRFFALDFSSLKARSLPIRLSLLLARSWKMVFNTRDGSLYSPGLLTPYVLALVWWVLSNRLARFSEMMFLLRLARS